MICARFPAFPSKPLTPGEHFILKNKVTFDVILQNLHQHVFALNQYFDEAGIAEVLSIPKSYFDMNRVRRFEDRRGRYINISGGHRETAYQPERFQRTIFLFGGCTVFGVGSDDSRTVASYLQMRCNKDLPEAGIIVQNYGYFLAGVEATVEENAKILGSLPVRPGDIVIYPISPVSDNGDFRCINLSKTAEQPRDYEVFFDNGHLTPDGNRLTAEGLFKGLMDMGALSSSSASPVIQPQSDQNNAVADSLPGSDLRSCHDFPGYLRLLKKYAQ